MKAKPSKATGSSSKRPNASNRKANAVRALRASPTASKTGRSAGNSKRGSSGSKSSVKTAGGRPGAPARAARTSAGAKQRGSDDRRRELERQQREGEKKLRPKPVVREKKQPPPNPSDLERPAPNEPVRIQPPAPRFAKSSADEEDGSQNGGTNDARDEEMSRERERLRADPERRRAVDRTPDVNRWVHQRMNQPRGGRWQMHGHATFRGR